LEEELLAARIEPELKLHLQKHLHAFEVVLQD
jgi:hypothetical protein